MTKKSSRIKQSDIASMAGVGKSTVSMILNGQEHRFSAEVVERVLNADKKLSYSTGRFGAAGELGDIIYCVKKNNVSGKLPPLYTEIAFALEKELTPLRHELLLKNIDAIDKLKETVIQRGNRIKGIVFHGDFEHEDFSFISGEIPHLLLIPHFRSKTVPMLDIDNCKGAFDLTAHLKALGHRRLVFFGYVPESRHFSDRLDGFLLATRKLELEEVLPFEEVNHGLSFENVEAKATELLKKIKKMALPPTAVVCSCDAYASVLAETALHLKIKVPEDISITGYNNLFASRPSSIPLTCVEIPVTALAEKAIGMLAAIRHGYIKAPVSILISCGKVIQQNSTAAPRF